MKNLIFNRFLLLVFMLVAMAIGEAVRLTTSTLDFTSSGEAEY